MKSTNYNIFIKRLTKLTFQRRRHIIADMKIKNLFASTVAALTLNTAIPAQAQSHMQDTETPRGLFTIIDSYNELKATANTEEFWLLMREIRLSDAGLQGPVARLTLMMDTISTDKYSRNHEAMRHLAICANRDIATIASIVHVGHGGIIALANRAYENMLRLENATGDKWARSHCDNVFKAYVPR